MALESTDLFVVQRQTGGTPLLKATAAQLNTYVRQTLNDVTLKGNDSQQDIILSDSTLRSLRTDAADTAFNAKLNGTDTFTVFADGSGTFGSGNILLNADGSIVAAGNAQLTKPRSSTPGEDTGALCINPSNTAHYYNFRVDGADNNNLHIDTLVGANKITFAADGSGTFGSGNISLNANGSATFAGDITTGNDPTGGAGIGANISNNGYYQACRASGLIFRGYTQGNSTATSQILADGSAEFAGSGSFAGNAFQVGDDAGGSTLRIIQNDTTADALKIGTNSVSDAVVCKSDGSATFSGALEAESIDGGTY